jgi:hypothetical protein
MAGKDGREKVFHSGIFQSIYAILGVGSPLNRGGSEMAGLEEQASALAGETLHRLSGRLNVIWQKWGTEDYPDDNGVGFRNQLFLFADWMLYLFRQACSDDPEVPNQWIRQSASKFMALDSEEFMRCIGISRIHMQAFWWQLAFSQNPSLLVNARRVQQSMQTFGRELDWIYTVHDVPTEVGGAYHQLVLESIEDGDDYVEDSKEQLGKHLVRTQLGWCDASSPEGWDHWACGAFMSARNQLEQDPVRTQQFCEQVFGQF